MTDHSQYPFQIVILDDNESTLNLARAALEHHLNCQVRICSSSGELFILSEETKPDLILLDVDPEDEWSLSACQVLKKNLETENTPIIFLSAYKDPAKRVAALKAGGADYLDKPFYPEELVTRVKSHAEMHRLRLENLNQIEEQQALLQVLCHDLVNPIFAAHSLMSLRRETGNLDLKLLNSCINCCQSAMDIITHVRSEHSLVRKDKQFKTEQVRIEDAFEESLRTLATRFEQKEVELEIQADPKAYININRVVLVHNILNNLLTNALKFSYPNSKVDLRSSLAEEDGQLSCLIEICDHGIGMPPEILQNVFDENVKVSRPGTSSEQGTGFGMPLVKRYVEKSNGIVHIDSVAAEDGSISDTSGTTVRLTFPVSS